MTYEQATDCGPNPHYEGQHIDEPEWCWNMRRELIRVIDVADVHHERLESRIAELEREREEALDKALRYDLDQVGITRRELEAIKLVNLRAELARVRDVMREAFNDFHGAKVLFSSRYIEAMEGRAALAREEE